MMWSDWIGLIPGIAVLCAALLVLILRARAWRAHKGTDACARCPYASRCPNRPRER